ncbi:MAG: hypothetical protein J6B65_01870 [Paludibacteraceae bacterium]|nr:hypothetical protein [Paludibacteraceae bacterium]
MEENVFDTIVFNKHLLIDDGRGAILVDTGSPTSFHESRKFNIGEDEFNVSASCMGVNAKYLTEKVGCDIVGLIGMDIISKYSLWINTENFGNFISFYKENASFSRYSVKTFSAMGVPGIVMNVGAHEVKLLFDTGAPISYLSNKFLKGEELVGTCRDFSPLTHTDYDVNLYRLPVDFCEEEFDVEFGSMPAEVAMLLGTMGVDGIIGYDLFSRFRIIVENGKIVIPPQGI